MVLWNNKNTEHLKQKKYKKVTDKTGKYKLNK